MSEPTLYRFTNATPGRLDIEWYVQIGELVPVERCEHGNIDPHYPYYPVERMDPATCPGAKIGGDDA